MTSEEYHLKKSELVKRDEEIHKAIEELDKEFNEERIKDLNNKYQGKYIISYKRCSFSTENNEPKAYKNDYTIYYIKDIVDEGHGFVTFEGYGLAVAGDQTNEVNTVFYIPDKKNSCYKIDKVISKEEVQELIDSLRKKTTGILDSFKIV